MAVVRERIAIFRSNVPCAEDTSSGLLRSPMPPCAVIAIPSSSAVVQNRSSASDGVPAPCGNCAHAMERNPSACTRRSSASASSSPEVGMTALPISRSGRDGAVVLGEERVVRAHHRQVRLAVGQVLDEPGDEHRRVQHLGVDPVGVLLAQALRGVAGAGDRRAVVVPVRLALHPERPARRDVLPVVHHRAALDQPALAAGGELDQARRLVAVLVGNVAHPGVGRDLQMAVRGDDPVGPGVGPRAHGALRA